jgi:hypothetical protein
MSSHEHAEPGSPGEPGKRVTVYQAPAIPESIVVASIRLAYLKFAVLVILVIVIVWLIYTRSASLAGFPGMRTPSLASAASAPGSVNVERAVAVRPIPTPAPIDDTEHFAPYASWLVPDIYRSDPAHDENISNDSHYGQYAPYDLRYLQPNNPDIPASKMSNAHGVERLVTYNQHDYDTDQVAGEADVPEAQLEAESGLLFGLSNHEDIPVSTEGVL